MSSSAYLVFLGTSRQGRATIAALQAKGVTEIVTTSRDPESESSKKLVERFEAVHKVLKVDYGDAASIVGAIRDSQATRIWFTTDWNSIKSPTREKEFLTGKAVVDAIVECANTETAKIEHVVYNSVGDADNCPKEIAHFWSKADVEVYLEKELTPKNITWAVLRPVAFFDNLDDPKNYNPLTKGVVKFPCRPQFKAKYIATEDIGKGCAALLLDPAKFAGKKIEAAGGEHDGPGLAAALTEASGVDCVYKVAVPRFILWLMMRELYHMTLFIESPGYSADVAAFKEIVPDAMDAKAWFAHKGQWANGEKFQPKE